jgi:phosphate:Na+ symporter
MTALTGLWLVFIDISAMQNGVASFKGLLTPDIFPDDKMLGRFQLLFLGVAITLVIQSSSAGVAIALTVLGTGTVNFPQAAALVIGMDIRTTITAALATIGGARAMRQAGLPNPLNGSSDEFEKAHALTYL